MLTSNRIKYIKSLALKKNRLKHGEFIVEGVKNINDLKQSSIIVNEVFVTNPELVTGFEKITLVKNKDIERISNQKSPSGALALCKIPANLFDVKLFEGKVTLVLDKINDPGNLGTIIRIADWFGIENIICSQETVDAYSPKVVQSTMGSIGRVKVFYSKIEDVLSSTNIPIYGTFMSGIAINEIQPLPEVIIVIGSESHGISPDIELLISNKITIPKIGSAESLNAAVATGIVCSHFKI